MTDSVAIQLVHTVGIIITGIFSYLASRNAKEARAVAAVVLTDVAEVKTDVAEVKKHTNAMKDELVAATDRASHAEGHAEGLAEGLAEPTRPPMKPSSEANMF